MKIAFCGVPTVGKTDLVKMIMEKWPDYIKSVDKNPDLYCEAARNDIGMLDKIMDEFVNEAMFVEGKKNIVHDGCVLDALAHIYMFFGMHPEANSDILAKYHGLMYAAIQYYDIIFYVPYRTKYKRDLEKITKDEFLYYTKLDEFYSAIFDEWKKTNKSMFPFTSKLGCPPIIEVFGQTAEDQLAMLQLYIDENGDAVPPQQKDAPGVERAKTIDELSEEEKTEKDSKTT